MCGGGQTSTSTTTNTQSQDKVFSDAQQNALNAAKLFQSRYGGTTPQETQAYGGILQNSEIAEGYKPYIMRIADQMFRGGGYGEGANAIRDAYNQSADVYSPYMQGNYLDPMSNPYTQPAIEAARSGAFNDVANRFHQAGRSFSGAESGAFGRAAAASALPMLMNQYNTNVGAQQAAAQGLLSGSLGAAGGLDTTQGNILKAQLAAPGMLGQLNIPENMMLGIEDRQRAAAAQAAALQSAAVHGGASTGGTSTSTTTGPAPDPFQTLLGGGLGLLGLFL